MIDKRIKGRVRFLPGKVPKPRFGTFCLHFWRKTQLSQMVLGVMVYAFGVPKRSIWTVFSNFYSLFNLKVGMCQGCAN